MGEHLRRAQILLRSSQVRALHRVARNRSSTISAVVRDFVDHGLRELEPDEALASLDRLSRMRAEIEGARGLYPGDPVSEARLERSQALTTSGGDLR